MASNHEVDENEGDEPERDELAGEDEADDELDDELDEDALELTKVSAAAKASAARLIELLVEKKGLALLAKKPGTALLEAVARVVESPLPVKVRASKLSEALVDSEDVDDLFVDDEILGEILKRW